MSIASQHFGGAIDKIPVNVLPKTRSSGGTSCLGVIVSVTDSFEASRPGSRDNESSAASMAFCLCHDVLANDLCNKGCDRVSDASGVAGWRRSRGRSMVAL